MKTKENESWLKLGKYKLSYNEKIEPSLIIHIKGIHHSKIEPSYIIKYETNDTTHLSYLPYGMEYGSINNFKDFSLFSLEYLGEE